MLITNLNVKFNGFQMSTLLLDNVQPLFPFIHSTQMSIAIENHFTFIKVF